ncbi:MAG: phosphatidylglycerol lysyltransferase domain-containing protein [Acidobacteriota bacterium]
MAALPLLKGEGLMRGEKWPLRVIALITAGSGIANLASLTVPGERRWATLPEVFPLALLHASRFLVLLTGFALVISSWNLLKRKKRAFYTVLFLSVASVTVHLMHGLDYAPALYSLLVVAVLLMTRKEFTVHSDRPGFRASLIRLLCGFLLAVSYGVAGFWLLDTRDFGVSFTLRDSIHHTFDLMTLRSDPGLVAHTRYGNWFLDSVTLMTSAAVLYALFSIFRPVLYIYRTQPKEREEAAQILVRWGRSSLDYFKTWPDKSYFFSASRQAFLSYRVAANIAVVLGDPVGPGEEMDKLLGGFLRYCKESDWRVAFYQTLPDLLPLYHHAGMRELKIGEDAVVDLETFSLQGGSMRSLRRHLRRLEEQGLRAIYIPAPLPAQVISQARLVSEDWQRIHGRRERSFTLGMFNENYIRSTPLFAVEDQGARMLAFVNIIPSFRPGEATVDLLRRLSSAPNGTMDFLFVRLLSWNKEQGYLRFNLGMAPMAEFSERDKASREERLVYNFFRHLNFIFSYKGISQFKSKFATGWEPCYALFQSYTDLPRLALALYRLSNPRLAPGGLSHARFPPASALARKPDLAKEPGGPGDKACWSGVTEPRP